MRKVYVVYGECKDPYYRWVSGIYTSREKANKRIKILLHDRPQNNYYLETEVLQ